MLARASLGIAIALCVSGTAQADLSISNKPTQNVICDAGVCTATAKGANLNVTDLTNMLATGDTTVKFGGGALAIQVLDEFSWTSGSRLTLDANTSVGFHKMVTVAGQGALAITYNDGSNDGDLKFFGKGKIDFEQKSSQLTINNKGYTLIWNVESLTTGMKDNPSGNFAIMRDFSGGTHSSSSAIHVLFKGVLEGLGHSIRNLTINNQTLRKRWTQGGFLARNYGTLRDFAFQNAQISVAAYRSATGIVVGLNYGTIEHVHVSGSVNGRVDGGGIAGWSSGHIVDCESEAQVSSSRAGGVVGLNHGSILRSRATGAVTGYLAGGLVGWQLGTVDQSYATGSVTVPSSGHGGGLSGGTFKQHIRVGPIYNSYSTGPVDGSSSAVVGGLEGRDVGGAIYWSYTISSLIGGAVRGGLVGQSHDAQGRFLSDYWDTDMSGATLGCGEGACEGVVGITDAQLKSGLPDGFDPKIWGQSPSINNGYPYLRANPPL